MSRRLARELALQTLFQLDFSQTDWPDALAVAEGERENIIIPASLEYAKAIIPGTLENLDEIDCMVDRYAKDWTVDRLALVDRDILRIAIYEMCFSLEKINPGVAINEALEIAKVYGSDESPRFINGILGKMAKTMKE